MEAVRIGRYYAREFQRRLAHYVEKRRRGFRDHGSLERAAETILTNRAERGFEAGGHFRGVWPRDLAFGARGLSAAGFDDAVAETGRWLVDQLADGDVFYTDFHDRFHAATPAEGVDTFPALVLLLAECGCLREHADAIADLAAVHRERFVADSGLVTGSGSSWWDSAAAPRETYNTAVLLAAVERLEERDIETVFTGESAAIREALYSQLWNGRHFDEHRTADRGYGRGRGRSRGSPVLACDANVVPLYLGLVDDDRAASIVSSLEGLDTPYGLAMRAEPFSHAAVHPFFLLHRDYHYHIWPWNSLMYALGLRRYGYDDRARRELERVEALLEPYGNFLEVCTLEGEPYVKRGYASAEDFTVAAALWTEYQYRAG
ncbi:MGH1-like glycoside hydrolase domain-containing protein [Natronorubrum sp. FCH18a]|uniref:MGH1-like glycoside hydrolase domain-containing protein n=1 Tax=Natronorubrum sp. FCH18a TaxID=3447018 RepID=UPI003F50FC7C